MVLKRVLSRLWALPFRSEAAPDAAEEDSDIPEAADLSDAQDYRAIDYISAGAILPTQDAVKPIETIDELIEAKEREPC